jgi:rhodanese-related sulfurtransferase
LHTSSEKCGSKKEYFKMGPLVPDMIGNELNFIAALFIGIAFGFILEQAGFSTSKKLVGLFYGYDFTVLRVFFTAGITAMIGIIALGHYGLLDINLIYINPTYLWSAIIGGLIMGVGFVAGGFCPGTSFCAAAIGKIDAMIFIAGSFLGVFIFAEGYHLFEELYKAEYWGYARIFDTVGMSQGLFAFLLTAAALGAFWGTTLIENKVNGKPNPEFKAGRLYIGLTGIAMFFGFSAFFMPDVREAYKNEVSNKTLVESYQIKMMSPDELALRLMNDDKRLQLIDMRSEKDYKILRLPQSLNISIDNLFDKDIDRILSLKGKENIFIAESEFNAKQAAIIAEKIGYENIKVLSTGFEGFRKDILNFKKPKTAAGRLEADTFRFREKASKIMPVLIEQSTQKIIPRKESKRIIGGC